MMLDAGERAGERSAASEALHGVGEGELESEELLAGLGLRQLEVPLSRAEYVVIGCGVVVAWRLAG
jgi:hypothetical protein